MATFKINSTGEEFQAADVRAAMAVARTKGVRTYYGFSYKCPVSGHFVPADQLP